VCAEGADEHAPLHSAVIFSCPCRVKVARAACFWQVSKLQTVGGALDSNLSTTDRGQTVAGVGIFFQQVLLRLLRGVPVSDKPVYSGWLDQLGMCSSLSRRFRAR
jgi:hypothetical protein